MPHLEIVFFALKVLFLIYTVIPLPLYATLLVTFITHSDLIV